MTIEEQIKSFISKDLLYSNNGFPYGNDESLLEQGIIDSIGIMQLVLFIEEHFQIIILDHEITPSNFDSVASLVGYIKRKKNL